MPDTQREKVIDNLQASLEAITVANGFETDVGEVFRLGKIASEMMNLPSVVIVPGSETNTQTTNKKITNNLSINLECVFRDDDSIDTSIHKLLGDIEKKLYTDPTRGDLAINTTITGSSTEFTEYSSGIYGLSIQLEIIYRHVYADPFTKG